MPTTTERAFQIWPLLAYAARNHQLLTYDQVAECTGVHRAGLGQCLEPIQSLCLEAGYPPLTMLVVSKTSGLPGFGFSAVNIRTPEDFAAKLQQIFNFDWTRKAPDVSMLDRALANRPSNGV